MNAASMSANSFRRARALAAVAALVAGALLLQAAPALAQQPGRITGQVVTAQTGEPVASAQVVVVGTNRGSLTDNRGNFIITNVAAGSHQVQVRSVGYRTATQTVQVAAGEAANVTFQLAISAVALDEIVVTGQATGTARREIGTSIASVNVADLDHAPVANFSQLLQARAPGVNVLSGGGKSGQGTRIVMRGAASITQRNEPLIYVDGVRIDNSSASGISTTTAGVSWSGLDDINPADIERIEIIRGASAATLYGTEAAAGVIQIFTRRGREGTPTWRYEGEYSLLSTPREWWDVSAYSDWYYDAMVETGHQQGHQLSVSGGTANFGYYAGVNYRTEDGILPNSGEDFASARFNLSLLPRQNLTLRLNSAFSRRSVQHVPDANNTRGYTINGLVGGPRGQFGTPTLEHTRIEAFQNGNRFTGGVTAEHNPFDFFSHRMVLGADIFNSDEYQLFPFGAIQNIERGFRSNYRRQNLNLNVDYGATARFQLTRNFRSTTSAGFQYFDRDQGWSSAIGSDFPFFGLETVSAAITTTGAEGRLQERTAGFFVEQQFGFWDLFFLTLGTRADAHSAFGEDVDYQLYPKADVSYVISEHAFFPRQLGTLRLRAAYGTAGQQPTAFSAVRTWSPEAAVGAQPAVMPDNIGNPNLKPEVSHELELGLDAAVLNERLNIEVTRYDQRTEDALYRVRQPPSLGFLSPQLENVGEIHNEGWELSLRGLVLDLPRLRWEATANYSTNNNRIVNLGGGAPIQLQWLQFMREGYPVGSFFGDRVIQVGDSVDLASRLLRQPDGSLPEGWDYLGQPLPTRSIQLGSNFTFGPRVSLNVLVDHRGGHHLQSSTMRWLMDPRRDILDDPAVHQGAATPGPVANRCRNNPDAVTQVVCRTNSALTQGDFAYPADFWKLREVSLAYRLPDAFPQRFGLSSASVSLAGRNLWRHQKYPGLEAEAMYRNDLEDSAIRNQIFFDTPIPRRIVLGVSAQF
ncbi:MAG: TonB-dependent receptor [Gemmatimonadetes bacterium]|nr:TonB-dependent receptor [Gemmatimonadota bacterium]